MSTFSDEQKLEIKTLVREALAEYFEHIGQGTRFWLVTTATVVGSLVVIGGGLKWLLGLLGFTYIAK